jgi:ferritin-like metal-binding protein YciE
MSQSSQKLVRHLQDAHASEVALVRVLESRIAATPGGRYRVSLERHVLDTRDHAERLHRRLDDLGHGVAPRPPRSGRSGTVATQALRCGKAPVQLVRRPGGEVRVLEHARDAAATEALEVATYTAIERLAHSIGDLGTARMASAIRRSEEHMLGSLLSEIPRLAADADAAKRRPAALRAGT